MGGIPINEFHAQSLTWAIGTIVFIAITSISLGYIAQFIARLTRLSHAEQKRVFWGFTFAGPWIIGFIIFVVGPAIASLLYSFTNYELGNHLVFYNLESGKGNFNDFWIELGNYRELLTDTESGKGRLFKQALFNSFYYTIIGVPLQIMAALAMAMLLNRKIPGISVFRTIYYLPVILAASPAALLAWRYMFTSNGGFINNTLRWFSEQFFVFDWMYRYSIYFTEGFNGFYQSVSRNESVGSFKYTLPTFLALLFLLPLIGEWNPNKRQRAYTIAEIFSIIMIGNLLSTGVFSATINPSWTYFAIAVFVGMIAINHYQEKASLTRMWQIGGLILFALSVFRTVQLNDFDVTHPDTMRYLIPLTLGIILIAATFFTEWNMRKYQAALAIVGVMFLIIVGRALPSQIDDGGLKPLVAHLTFGNTVNAELATHKAELTETVNNLDPELSDRNKRGTISDEANIYYSYWKDEYGKNFFSAYWYYGAMIIVLLGLWFLDEKYPQARQYLLYGSLVFFALIAINSFRDGQKFFNGFDELEQIATVDGLTNARDTAHYHFVTFRDRTENLPSENRVPQWLQNELWTKPSLILITMWSSGASMLIFLAALKGVPPVLYEAAEVDGANQLQRFFKITLPMISPAMFYNIVIGVIAALQTFESIYIIRDPSGANDASLRSAAYFLFTRTFNDLAIGQGAAASWILAAIILTLTVLQFRYSNWVNYEA